MAATLTRLEQAIPKPDPDFGNLLTVLTRSGVPACVPFYELFADIEFMRPVLGKNIRTRVETVEFYYKAGYDYVPVWPEYRMKLGGFTTAKDDHPVKDRASFEAYAWPEPGTVSFAEFDQVAPIMPDGMKMIGQTGGIFEMLHQLIGYEDLCLMFYDDPDLLRDILSRIMVLYREMYEGMAAIPGVGALVISDDLGFKTQPLVSGDLLREFIFPLYKELTAIIHGAGKPCILHSCGQIYGLIDDLVDDVGIDGKHSYEDVILPVEEAYKLYGSRVAILGGLDLDLLVRGTPAEIQARTAALVTGCGYKGSYALGSGNSIADYVPIENYLTMLKTGWEFRRTI